MTTTQIETATKLQQQKLRKGYEVKQFEVHQVTPRTIGVLVTVGLIGDEGTAAAVYGRDRGYFFIGKRGKVSAALKARHATAAQVKRNPTIFGWTS